MSLNATLTISTWAAVGATTAVTMRSITAAHLRGPAAFRSHHSIEQVTVAQAPRPPPDDGLAIGQAAITAVLFGMLAWRFGVRIELLAFSCLAALGVPLAVIDAVTMRLPRQLVHPLYPICVSPLALAAVIEDDGPRFARAAAGMFVLLVAYLVTAVLSHGGLGAGDVRAAGPIGLTLAWAGWSALLAGTLFSLVIFSAMATLAKCGVNSRLRQEWPFGPAMFGGAFLAILTR
ncbi:prepilin peptidase [Actinophytocola oryzae]|uniref:Type IV leader peptidase family protein n=1 Tax=Actinophytocola oryzae TaxID=502181 RepID=A0A4R7V661_9PSEU|nr:A24 family peptidase [Actinophytocola oryzae]TDV44177.1 type IV leader peptidase family protein [Actinophytocola oryzae]